MLPPLNLNLAQNTSSGADGTLNSAPINFKSNPVTGASGINWTWVIVAVLAVVALVVFKKRS